MKNGAVRGASGMPEPCGRAWSVQGRFVNRQVAGVIRVSVPFTVDERDDHPRFPSGQRAAAHLPGRATLRTRGMRNGPVGLQPRNAMADS
jgi:hypothetical protein